MTLFPTLLLFGVSLAGAELSVGRQTASPGNQARVPVVLKTEGAAITALQFDIEFDPTILELAAAIGPAGEKASKRIASADAGKNRKRFLIFGMNHNVIEDGVVVLLDVTVRAGAADGDYVLTCRSGAGSNAAAGQVELRVVNGAVAVRKSSDGRRDGGD